MRTWRAESRPPHCLDQPRVPDQEHAGPRPPKFQRNIHLNHASKPSLRRGPAPARTTGTRGRLACGQRRRMASPDRRATPAMAIQSNPVPLRPCRQSPRRLRHGIVTTSERRRPDADRARHAAPSQTPRVPHPSPTHAIVLGLVRAWRRIWQMHRVARSWGDVCPDRLSWQPNCDNMLLARRLQCSHKMRCC